MRDGEVLFELAGYDKSLPVTIDPTVTYASYLGGTGWDGAFGVAVDAAGNAYIVGRTTSSGFPGLNGFDRQIGAGDEDAFVTKVNAAGTAIVYSTYLGGAKGFDEGFAIAVDSSGNAVVTGIAGTGFPVTTGAYQTASTGSDSFVTKLNSTGTALLYSTYVQGTSLYSVVLDSSGNAFVTGDANSAFRTTAGAYQTAWYQSPINPYNNVSLLKLNATGTAAVYSTFLNVGGAKAVAIDDAGNAYVGGYGLVGSQLCAAPFVYKVNSTGSSLTYAKCFGAGEVSGIAVDSQGNAHVAGNATGAMPIVNAFQTTASTAFVGRLEADGNTFSYLSYIGGSSGLNYAEGVALDAGGNAIFVGYSPDVDFPLLNNPFPDKRHSSYGAWVTRISPSGHRFFTAMLSGSGNASGVTNGDRAHAVATDSSGGIYVVGETNSSDFPVTAAAFQKIWAFDSRKGVNPDAFIAKLTSPTYSASLATSANNIASNQSTTLSVNVSGPTNPVIGQVLLFDGGTPLASLALSNGAASSVFSNLAVGIRRLTAVYDNAGDGASSPVVLQGINQPSCGGTSLPQTVPSGAPIVVLTSPSNCTILLSAAAVTLAAEAAAPAGTISKVEFRYNNTSIATVTKPPFSTTWTPPGLGSFTITAVATNTSNISTTSAPILVSVSSPPTVTLTSPGANDQFRLGNPVPLSATASDADGIASVEFLSSGQVVATTTASPYTASWTPPSLGSYSISARATDNASASATTPAISIGVVSNAAPKVTLTAPTNGATFAAPVDIPVQATATDDVAVDKVEFFWQAVLIDTVTGAGPTYSTTWKNVLPGSYSVTARATDNEGASTTSAPANIAVTGVAGNIDSPKTGASVSVPYGIAYRAATSSGLIHTVEFLDNGSVFYTLTWDRGSTLNGNMTITGAPLGSHSHTIRVTTSTGSAATSPAVVVNVVPSPTVALTAPIQNQFYIAPAFVLLRPSLSNFTNQVTRVDYFADGQHVAGSDTPPFEVFWPNVGLGSYSVVAKATDSTGTVYSSPSAAIEVGSAPRITITSPATGQVPEDRAYLAGTARTPRNSAISVNGQPASIDDQGNWFVENVPLDAGDNTLNIVISALDSDPVVSSLAVSSAGVPEYDFVVDPASATTPSSVDVRLTHRGSKTFNRAEFDVNGDGTTDYTATTMTDNDITFSVNVTGAGVLPISVQVFDQGGVVIYSATRHVLAVPQDKQAAFIKDEYLEIMSRLKAGDISGAVKRLTTSHQTPLSNMFNAFGTELASVVDQLGTVGAINPHDDIVGLELVRGSKVFPLNFVRNPDGIWRLDGM